MNAGKVAWVLGGYLAGTLPFALIVARVKGATGVVSSARRDAGEADAHILMWKELGLGWAIVAGTSDVLKGFVYVLAARHWGRLDPGWLAVAAVAVVVGHSFPFYARAMGGRGLSAASGVSLVLLPVEMIVAGVVILIGGATRSTGVSTTIAFASIPVVAAFRSQPGPFIAMAALIFAILLLRRVEGVRAVIRSGVPAAKAIWDRAVFDSSGRR